MTPVPDVPRSFAASATRGDDVYRRATKVIGASTLVLMGLIALFLVLRSWDAMSEAGWHFFTRFEWSTTGAPGQRRFGVAALLWGTSVIAVIALVIAIPVSLSTALFISEYAPRRIRKPLTALVDLLAAVPSVIYGFWGLRFLGPKVEGLAAFLTDHASFVPVFRTDTEVYSNSFFLAGLVVSLMVVPIVTSIVREVFSQAPIAEREGALALGSTRWGMIRTVVLPFGRGGIIGGTMLGLGRALGETIAVTILFSPRFEVSTQWLQGGSNSVAAHIASTFSEANDFEVSALMGAGLTLFAVTLAVNFGAAMVVSRSRSGAGVEL